MGKLVLSMAIMVLGCPVGAYVSSTFDHGAEGWVVADLRDSGGPYEPPLGNYAVTWASTGGYPNGHIWSHDPSSYSFSFAAPAQFLGDDSDYYGGVLRFAMKSTHSNWTADNVVVLVGNNGKVVVSQILPIPSADWRVYTIGLNEANFRYNNKNGSLVSKSDFQGVLGGLKALRIIAEYGSAVVDTTYLDSVELSKADCVGIPNVGLAQPVAALAAGRYRFAVWGKATDIDSDYLRLDDGSGAPITIYAPGHSNVGGWARAAGFLDAAGTQRLLRCSPTDVTQLE